ncbi:MAG: Polysaccharide biosynthesis protein [Marmoricola sp.]|nr:Polysaccharide biosynthesis protein [Marmoricola sp.]
MSSPLARVRDLLRGSAGIAVAMGVMNVTTYGYTIIAARLLGPRSYGAFAAVMGLLLVVGVLQLGLQATGARRIAADERDVAEVERALVRVSLASALVLAAACLVLSPVINAVLHLGSLGTAVLVGLTAFPMTLMGGQAGILQGERRWTALSLLYLAAGVPRVLIGGALLLWRPTEAMAVTGVLVAFFAPVAVGWVALRTSRRPHQEHVSGRHDARSILGETLRNSHALLAFFALSNADVIVARDVLSGHQSGLYAGGLILVKAVLFLPQFVVIIAFPSMSTQANRRGALVNSVGLVLVLGAVCTAGAWILSSVAVTFVGGPAYAAIQGRLWLFAVLGTVLSILQLLVYSVVARQSRKSVYLIWAALVVLVLAARTAGDTTTLLLVVTGVDLVLLVVLLLTNLRKLGASEPVEELAGQPAA